MVQIGLKSLALLAVTLVADPTCARNIQAPNIKLPATAAGTKAQVKQAFQSAYGAYRNFSFGHDDLQPVSRSSNDMRNGWGATIFDAMDTMLVMGLTDDYQEAVRFVETVDFSKSKVAGQTVSVFETTIRYLGGMLSAYELNGRRDAILLSQSVKLADKLVHAWVGNNAVPYGQVDFSTNAPVLEVTNIAEAGTLTLEFGLLSQLTGDQKYARLAEGAVRAVMKNRPPLPALPAQGFDPKSGQSVGSYVTWGGGSDSYFEYLIKLPRMFSNTDPIFAQSWLAGVKSSIQSLMKTSTVGNHLYLADYDGSQIRHVGSHLACFHAGNWIMGGRLLDNEDIVNIALELNEGCWNTYQSTSTKIGPEAFGFVAQDGGYTGGDGASLTDTFFYNQNGFYILEGGSDYILRPEVLESNFYAYRATGKTLYLDRAKQTLSSFNKVLSVNGAFAGIRNVNSLDGTGGGFLDDTQSFFFAETLKYLYLTFDDPEKYSLDKYVFNTECHPFPVGPSNLKKRSEEPSSNGIRGSPHDFQTPPSKTSDTPSDWNSQKKKRASTANSGPVPQISPNPKMPTQLVDIFHIWALPFVNVLGN